MNQVSAQHVHQQRCVEQFLGIRQRREPAREHSAERRHVEHPHHGTDRDQRKGEVDCKAERPQVQGATARSVGSFGDIGRCRHCQSERNSTRIMITMAAFCTAWASRCGGCGWMETACVTGLPC